MPERTAPRNRHPFPRSPVRHSSTFDCGDNFKGELRGSTFQIDVRDFIVRDDHVAFDFYVKESGYEDFTVEGKLREITDESFARAGLGKYAGVVEYVYDGQPHLLTLRLETQCIGMMHITGEWEQYGETYDFDGDLEPVT